MTRQARRLSDGKINRRRFVMSALSAGVTMPTAVSLASRVEAAAPKPGGTFRIAVRNASTAETFDPRSAATDFGRLVAFTRGNALTEITPAGDVIGELAEHWETPDHGRNWHFTLRRDISFHSGHILNADHVTATLARHRVSGGLLADTAAVSTSGARRITLTLTRPDPDLPRRLADPRLVISGTSPDDRNGTGPYCLTDLTPGQRAKFVRNPAYWKPNRAHFDAVEIIAMPDIAARQQAVMTGEIDYADGIEPRSAALLKRVPNLALLETTGARHLALHTQGAGDALRHLVPGRALLERVLLGHGRLADGAAPSPQTARRLWARVKTPIQLALGDAGAPELADAARLIAEAANRAGIPVDVLHRHDPSADAEIGWARGGNGESLVAVWSNDLAAHSRKLAHGSSVGTHAENDGARITERWWFA